MPNKKSSTPAGRRANQDQDQGQGRGSRSRSFSSNTRESTFSGSPSTRKSSRRPSSSKVPHKINVGSTAASKSGSGRSWLGRLVGGVFAWSGRVAGRAIGETGQRASRRGGRHSRYDKRGAGRGPANTNHRAKYSGQGQGRGGYRGQKKLMLAQVCDRAIGMEIELPSVDLNVQPWVIASSQHQFLENYVSPAALKVLKKLHAARYQAYLVGGGVRDVLLGKTPKDFDVVTDAKPEQIKSLFNHSRIIGRRFRLVHVYFRGEVIEVSTFRAGVQEVEAADEGSELTTPQMLGADNVYGTIEEDAWRRDFTVNAIYYNIADHTLVDYTGGLRDLQHKTLQVIGDPRQRFHEDPIRMLRAVRMAGKLDLSIEEQAKITLVELGHLLEHVPPARLFDEVLKLLFHGNAVATFELLKQFRLLQVIFPKYYAACERLNDPRLQCLVDKAVEETDKRAANGQSLNPGFLLSVILWPVVMECLQDYLATVESKAAVPGSHQSDLDNDRYALLQVREGVWRNIVFDAISVRVSFKLPRRMMDMVRDIWDMQWSLELRAPSRIHGVLQMRYFRAAVDFLELRAGADYPLQDCSKWWWYLREASHADIEKAIADLPPQKQSKARRKPSRKHGHGKGESSK